MISPRKRANYLAFNRHVIIEQKSLEVDPDYKIQTFIDDLLRARGIIDADQVSLVSFAHVLTQLPDGDDSKKQLYQKLTKGIDDMWPRRTNKPATLAKHSLFQKQLA